MPNQAKLDKLYIDIACRLAQESYAKRLKVGFLVVKDDNIISYGWNGMPSGYDNTCEIENPDGSLTTKPEVLHAERNAVEKLIRANTDGQLDGAIGYATHSPCPRCADLIIRSKLSRIIYLHEYRDTSAIEDCLKAGIDVRKFYQPEDMI